MFLNRTFKKPLPLGERKERLRQALLTQSGGLVDPRTLPVPPEPNPEPEKPKAVAKVRNVVHRTPPAASVNFVVPNDAGHLSSVITGIIYGKVYRTRDAVTVNFKRDSDGAIVTVRGRLPVVETGLRYTMEVNLTLEHGKQIYMFQKLCGQGIVALPVDGLEFRNILSKLLRLELPLATVIALEVAEKYVTNLTPKTDAEKLRSAKIPISHIYDNFKEELWYPELCKTWGQLKYKFYPELMFFWDYDDLCRLNLVDLKTLYEKFKANPIEFFLVDNGTSRLPAVSMDKVHLVSSVFKCEFTAEMVSLIKFFNAISAEITETKCICMTLQQLKRLASANAPSHSEKVIPMALSAKYKLLVAVHETGLDEDPHRAAEEHRRFYRTKDHMHLKILRFRLNRIMSRPPNCILPLEGVTPGDLRPEMRHAVQNLIEKVNIVLVSGDAGTGKTSTSVSVYELYGKTRCLPVAAYTGLATRNHRAMMSRVKATKSEQKSSGVTIDYLIEIVKRETKQGQKLANCVEVLLIDEVGVVSMDKFSQLLALLPNVKKIFMTGDVKQCKPVTPGRILDGFLGSWSNTDHIVYLTKNLRVDPNYTALVDNFAAFLEGRFSDIRFSTDLIDEVPFKVIRRQSYPDFGGNRSDTMMRELQGVYYWLSAIEPDASQITIISHTNADVDDLNTAWLSLKNGGQSYRNNKKVIRVGDLVRFTCPFRPSFRATTGFGNSKFVQQHLACDKIDTNTIAEVEEIYDISTTASAQVAYRNRQIISSTNAPYVSADMVRMIRFADGTQINLRDYSINNIVPGYATTILSSIGHDRNWVVIWIPPWQRHVYRETLYTAMTRARKGVIFIMGISDDMDLNRSDLSAIWSNLSPPTENAISLYIPKVAQAEEETDLESFLDAVSRVANFDPMSEAELAGLEDELRQYETVCPLLGDDSLERENERIMQHVAKLKESQRQQELEREEYQSDSLDLQPSQHEFFSNIPLDRTQTFDSLQEYPSSSESSEEPAPKKRHFAWISELRKQDDEPVQPKQMQPKRLRRSATSGSFSIEDSRTANHEDFFVEDEKKTNPFEELGNRPKAKSGRLIIED